MVSLQLRYITACCVVFMNKNNTCFLMNFKYFKSLIMLLSLKNMTPFAIVVFIPFSGVVLLLQY